MSKWILVAGSCLFYMLTGCSSDHLAASDTDVVITVQGESPSGTWYRDFRGPEVRADEFVSELARIASSLAKEFEGAIEARMLIDGVEVGHVVADGVPEEIVPAAIIASHDITALRLGFVPQGSLEDVALSKTVTGQAPCMCVGAGCCCNTQSCGEIWLRCEGCGKKYDGGRCAAGTQCWVAAEEQR